MRVLKNRHAPEVSETNCRARLSHSKQLLNADKYLPSGVTIIWFTDKKYLQRPHRKFYRMAGLYACGNQEERCPIQSACARDQRSVIASVGESQVVDNQYTSLMILVDPRATVSDGYCHNTTLSQQLMYIYAILISQASSLSQQDSARAYRPIKAIYFLARKFVRLTDLEIFDGWTPE